MEQTIIHNKLEEIGRFFFPADGNLNPVTQSLFPGLLGGRGGVLLFMKYYSVYTGLPEHYLLTEKYLEEYAEELTEGMSIFTYCNGLSGIFSLLEFLNNENLMDLDFSGIQQPYSPYMLERMKYDFMNRNFDFLHGATGVALYFDKDPAFIENALSLLEKTAIKENDTYKWLCEIDIKTHKTGYNISLSHGYASIAMYLLRVYKNGFRSNSLLTILEGIIKYILSQEVESEKYGCFFPSQSLENGDLVLRSRLGWCYGDLGIALLLWQAGIVLEQNEWKEKALQIMRFTAQRRDIRENHVVDAGICHGSSGIALIFQYFYRQTGEQLFGETADYWLEVTLAHSRFPDGYAGYKKYRAEGESKWENGADLLEGIAGIGLVFLYFLDPDKYENWISLLLLK